MWSEPFQIILFLDFPAQNWLTFCLEIGNFQIELLETLCLPRSKILGLNILSYAKEELG